MRDRATGWLDETFHRDFRELLQHAQSRYHLHCPAYCLMPDHFHLLWMGLWEGSDQLKAARFLRRHLNRLLAVSGATLQPQGHDRVLRKPEQERDAFEDAVLYVFRNPERAGLVGEWRDWPFAGAMACGYPELPVWPTGEFFRRFWIVHHREIRRFDGEEMDGEMEA